MSFLNKQEFNDWVDDFYKKFRDKTEPRGIPSCELTIVFKDRKRQEEQEVLFNFYDQRQARHVLRRARETGWCYSYLLEKRQDESELVKRY